MCEFKIVNQTDGSQIAEDILILSYTDDNELIFKDVLGMGDKLDSALIFDVNTINQRCLILQHPLIKDFLDLILSLETHNAPKAKIEEFMKKLEILKKNI